MLLLHRDIVPVQNHIQCSQLCRQICDRYFFYARARVCVYSYYVYTVLPLEEP